MIILYSLPTCPKCHVLELKMQAKNIAFEKCMDIQAMELLGLKSVPFLGVDGQLLNYEAANTWVKEQEARQ